MISQGDHFFCMIEKHLFYFNIVDAKIGKSIFTSDTGSAQEKFIEVKLVDDLHCNCASDAHLAFTKGPAYQDDVHFALCQDIRNQQAGGENGDIFVVA